MCTGVQEVGAHLGGTIETSFTVQVEDGSLAVGQFLGLCFYDFLNRGHNGCFLSFFLAGGVVRTLGLRPTAIPCAYNAECLGGARGQGCTYLETGRTEKPLRRPSSLQIARPEPKYRL